MSHNNRRRDHDAVLALSVEFRSFQNEMRTNMVDKNYLDEKIDELVKDRQIALRGIEDRVAHNEGLLSQLTSEATGESSAERRIRERTDRFRNDIRATIALFLALGAIIATLFVGFSQIKSRSSMTQLPNCHIVLTGVTCTEIKP